MKFLLLLLLPFTLYAETIKIIVSDADPFYQSETEGYEVEIAKRIAEYFGKELELIRTTQTEEALSLLETGKADISLGISSNLERSKRVNFTDPYIQTTVGALVDRTVIPEEPEGSIIAVSYFNNIYDLLEIHGLTFAVANKSTAYWFIKEKFSTFPINAFENDKEALESLQKEESDIYVTDSLYLEYQIRNKPDLKNKYRVILKPSVVKDICIAVNPKKDYMFLYKMNFLIHKLIQENYFTKLKKKYF